MPRGRQSRCVWQMKLGVDDTILVLGGRIDNDNRGHALSLVLPLLMLKGKSWQEAIVVVED